MRNYQKTAFIPYPELLTFLDRFCPMCNSPISLKKTGKLEALVCSNPKCPYYQVREKGNKKREGGAIEC
ncbi:hypothetical protein [Thermovibrio sp.]